MKFARPSVRAAAILAAAVYVAQPAVAGPVGPGQTINVIDDARFEPVGELLASQTFTQSVPLRATGGNNGEPVGFVVETGELGDINVGLTVDNRVYRAADGALTFVYALMADLSNANGERSNLTVGGFAGTSTDASIGRADNATQVARSADGATLVNRLTAAGLGGFPLTFAVRTDAAAFDAGGALNFDFGQEYVVRPLTPEFPDRPDLSNVIGSGTGNADFAGLYQPAAAAPAVVPLPSAAWGGGLTLAGMGLVALRRRRAGAARA